MFNDISRLFSGQGQQVLRVMLSKPISRLMHPFKWVRSAGDNVLGRERGQALVRVVVSSVTAFYVMSASSATTRMESVPLWIVVALYAVFAIAFFSHILYSKSSPAVRRFLANLADITILSYVMMVGGEAAMPLFVLYLWITLGNGFRFGGTALLVSAALGFAGFSAVVFMSQAWQGQEELSIGVFLALTILPLYAWHRIAHLKNSEVDLAKNLLPRLSATFRWFSQSNGNKLGRERGQALLRIIVSSVATLYLMHASPRPEIVHEAPPWIVIAIYAIFSVGLFWHILTSRTSSSPRRLLANLGDMAVITYTMAAAGEAGMPMFLLYLWVTLGNGFRFGERALLVSAVFGVVGFGVVVSATEAWQVHQALSTSIFLALIILPLYAAHLIKQLNKALAQAQEASSAKSQFLARMSHELRTPLNGILGASELLQSGRRLTAEERELLQVIRDSVQVSLRQIDNVLDFSKLEAGKFQLDRADIDLHEIVSTAVDMVRPVAAQKGLCLLIRIAPEAPFRLMGDAHHLRSILLNLLSNAVKFTERGQVCVEVEARGELGGRALMHIEVHDTGIGIAPKALGRIFESFSQEDTGTARRFGGTGLGTTIAKQLVELMGGRMGVQSVKGQGSTFWFEIPLERQTQTEGGVEMLPQVRAVLMSEDVAIAQHYTQVLGERGASLIHVPKSNQVLEAVARSARLGNPVQAILVDASLAIGDGGVHRCNDLCDKAAAANVATILVSDIAPPPAQLRQWGYGAVLAPAADPQLVHSALHALSRTAEHRQGVINVAPWMWGRRDGVRRRLLIADDNRTNLMIVRRMLEQAGYDIDVAETGDEALAHLCTGKYRLAVLDMHMPGLDGLAVLRRYRLLRQRSRVPVLILTANASMEAQGQCADAGADAYLTKPVTAADLLGEVERLLRDTEVEVLKRHDEVDVGVGTETSQIVDISVLAELDRLYHDPQELSNTIAEYEREGRDLLERVAQASASRNHAVFCDAVHALKGNAANVGASRLIEVCRDAEAGGIIEFMRARQRMLTDMRQAFNDTLAALRQQLPLADNEDGKAGKL